MGLKQVQNSNFLVVKQMPLGCIIHIGFRKSIWPVMTSVTVRRQLVAAWWLLMLSRVVWSQWQRQAEERSAAGINPWVTAVSEVASQLHPPGKGEMVKDSAGVLKSAEPCSKRSWAEATTKDRRGKKRGSSPLSFSSQNSEKERKRRRGVGGRKAGRAPGCLKTNKKIQPQPHGGTAKPNFLLHNMH